MSAREVTEWAAYEQVAGPLGAERDDVLASMQSFYALRAAGAKKVKLKELLPRWDRPKAMRWQDMKLIAQALANRYSDDASR